MASTSTNDTAEGDDAVWLFFFVDGFTNDGDFKGTGHSEKVDACFRGICRDFFDSVIDEGVGVFLVELCAIRIFAAPVIRGFGGRDDDM